MSTLEDRESLIQKRQAEKYINVVRLAVLVYVLFSLFLRDSSGLNPVSADFGLTLVAVVLATLYVAFVHGAVSRGFFPRYLPWFTTLTDLSFFVLAFGVAFSGSDRSFSSITVNLSWGYAVLLLLILFSTLREMPGLTLFNGLVSTVMYGAFVFLYFRYEPYPGFLRDQEFRMLFLALAGSFSSFHARSLRKAFARAAMSERLRRDTDNQLNVLAKHFPGVLLQADLRNQTFHLGYASEGSRELLGLDPAEVVAHPERFFRRTERAFRKALQQQYGSTTRDMGNWDVEFRYRHPDGRQLWLRMSVTTHVSSGVHSVNGLLTDISQQRAAAEALKEANQAKSDFLATMSHELRTPLNAILGNADHLSALAVTADDRKAFQDILASGETLLGLIEDTLVFSRLEAGRLTPELRPFEWRPQIQLLLDTFRAAAQQKGVALLAHLTKGAPDLIWGDVLRFRQILGNLLANAVKFTHRGHILVEVVFQDLPEGMEMRILVRDTGIGIAPEIQEKVFEKFVQGVHGKSRPYGGTGLGLAISRSLAKLLGGTLTLTSEPGAGSTFCLTLPVRPVVPEVNVDPGVGKPLAMFPSKILLVEDNRSNQEVATRMLAKLGATVELATNGVEAVAKCSEHFYDVIFMDWQMPTMDGKEATGLIRALPNGKDLVIVALSGHALPGDRETLLASGFDDYLSKPVRMDDFRGVLAKYLPGQQSTGALTGLPRG